MKYIYQPNKTLLVVKGPVT